MLNKYKDVLGKPYGRISLYICRNTDHMETLTHDFMCETDLVDLAKDNDSTASDSGSVDEIATKRSVRNPSTCTSTISTCASTTSTCASTSVE